MKKVRLQRKIKRNESKEKVEGGLYLVEFFI